MELELVFAQNVLAMAGKNLYFVQAFSHLVDFNIKLLQSGLAVAKLVLNLTSFQELVEVGKLVED